jgi:hypothetical protein
VGRKNKTPVVITRKDKKLGPLHGVAAILTGGASLLYTGPRAAANAGYNARTRQLQAEAEGEQDVPLFSEEEREAGRQAFQEALARRGADYDAHPESKRRA